MALHVEEDLYRKRKDDETEHETVMISWEVPEREPALQEKALEKMLARRLQLHLRAILQ